MTLITKKITAIGGIFFFLIGTTPVPLSYSAEAAPASKIDFPADPNQIAVPAEIGKIEQITKGANAKTVILIQDAHAIPDAQRNIEKLIKHFQKQYGIKQVMVEGAASELDPQIFRSFPDKKILQAVFDDYHQKAELTGSTAAAIFSEQESRYYGVEDWNLYEEGLYLYLLAMQNETELNEKLSVYEKDLQAKKQKAYSEQLSEIDRSLNSFYENQANLVDVLRKLSAVREPEKGTELKTLLDEVCNEGRDQSAVEIEVKRMANQVAKYLKAGNGKGEEKLRSFNAKLQEFQTSRISPQSFALFLKEVILENRLPLKVSDRLVGLMKHQKMLAEIEGTKLFKDFETYAAGIKESLFQSEEQRTLDQETGRIRLLKKLIRLELSIEDWETLKTSRAQSAESVESNPMFHALGSMLEPHFSFYENAEKRDHAFTANMTRLMDQAKTNVSILVSGGFHTQGVSRELKEKGYSCVTVFPQIGSIPQHSLYQDHMVGQVSWKDYLKVEDGKIDVFKAFVRATRDRLLEQSAKGIEHSGKEKAEPSAISSMRYAEVLKVWRDQIIRDSSAQGKIESVSNYTQFLDEVVAPTEARPNANDPLTRVDRFIEGFKSLQQRNEVTQQNVLQLFKAGTILDALGIPIRHEPIDVSNGRLWFENGRLIARAEMRNERDALVDAASKARGGDVFLEGTLGREYAAPSTYQVYGVLNGKDYTLLTASQKPKTLSQGVSAKALDAAIDRKEIGYRKIGNDGFYFYLPADMDLPDYVRDDLAKKNRTARNFSDSAVAVLLGKTDDTVSISTQTTMEAIRAGMISAEVARRNNATVVDYSVNDPVAIEALQYLSEQQSRADTIDPTVRLADTNEIIPAVEMYRRVLTGKAQIREIGPMMKGFVTRKAASSATPAAQTQTRPVLAQQPVSAKPEIVPAASTAVTKTTDMIVSEEAGKIADKVIGDSPVEPMRIESFQRDPFLFIKHLDLSVDRPTVNGWVFIRFRPGHSGIVSDGTSFKGDFETGLKIKALAIQKIQERMTAEVQRGRSELRLQQTRFAISGIKAGDSAALYLSPAEYETWSKVTGSWWDPAIELNPLELQWLQNPQQWLQGQSATTFPRVELVLWEIQKLAINSDPLGRTLRVTSRDPRTNRESTMDVPAGSFYGVPDYYEHRVRLNPNDISRVVRQVLQWRQAAVESFNQMAQMNRGSWNVYANDSGRVVAVGQIKELATVRSYLSSGLLSLIDGNLYLVGETPLEFSKRGIRSELRTGVELGRTAFSYLMSDTSDERASRQIADEIGRSYDRNGIIQELERLRDIARTDAKLLRDTGASFLSFGAEQFANEVQVLIDRLKKIPSGYSLGFVVPASPDANEIQTAVKQIGSLGFNQVFLQGQDRIGLNGLFRNAGMKVNNTGIQKDAVFLSNQRDAGAVVLNQGDLRGVQVASIFTPIVITDGEQVQNPFIRDYAVVLQAALALLIAHEGKASLLKNPVPLLEQYGLISSGYQNTVIQSNGNQLFISAIAVKAYLEWKATEQARISA